MIKETEITLSVPKVFDSEYKFCLILWENEPIRSGDLVKLCRKKLGWKPTTVYTVIKRLRDRGLVKSENGVVTSLVSKSEVQSAELDELIREKFDNSLMSLFTAAFTGGRKRLTDSEIDQLKAIIEDYKDNSL